MNFEELFISEVKPYKGDSKRDKFLSRVFGIFNEEIVRIWCANENSPFVNIGRPTIYDAIAKEQEKQSYYTLDFLLKDDQSRVYVTEMKCEIEYQKYKFLTLDGHLQLKHHKKRAFELFLELSKEPEKYVVKCDNEIQKIDGTALVWGRTSLSGVKEVTEEFNINHVISTEKVVSDLVDWEDVEFNEFIGQYQGWANQLFDGLVGKKA